MPGYVRKLKRRPNFQRVAISGPRIEEIAAPTIGSNLHVLGSLAVRMAVESGVAKHRVQESTRTQLVAVRNSDRYSGLSIVGRCGLRNQRADVHELPSQREAIEINVQEVARRHNHLEFHERRDASG